MKSALDGAVYAAPEYVPFHIGSQDQYLELVRQLVEKFSREHQLIPVLDDTLFNAAL